MKGVLFVLIAIAVLCMVNSEVLTLTALVVAGAVGTAKLLSAY